MTSPCRKEMAMSTRMRGGPGWNGVRREFDDGRGHADRGAVAVGRHRGDGDPDLRVSVVRGAIQLFVQSGDGVLSEEAELRGVPRDWKVDALRVKKAQTMTGMGISMCMWPITSSRARGNMPIFFFKMTAQGISSMWRIRPVWAMDSTRSKAVGWTMMTMVGMTCGSSMTGRPSTTRCTAIKGMARSSTWRRVPAWRTLRIPCRRRCSTRSGWGLGPLRHGRAQPSPSASGGHRHGICVEMAAEAV